MRTVRPRVVIGLLVLAGVVLTAWLVYEEHRQRQEIESALAVEARVLARSLGPGLEAATVALREIDELISWKLLDNARLLSALHSTGGLATERLSRIVEDNGLDSVVLIDSLGETDLVVGADVPDRILAQIREFISGEAEEMILGSSVEGGVEHVGAAVRGQDGGAVLVRVHGTEALAFVRALGVESLLRSLIGAGGVLYLGYREDPEGIVLEASWDERPIPAPVANGSPVRQVRGLDIFEVEVPIDAPAGTEATLRVGLDAAPLNRAASAAARRTLLVGFVLGAFGLALAGYAVVSSLRAAEREEAAQRLAASEQARRRSERLAAAGALTAGLAHEVRSPLNAIGLAAQRIERKYPGSEECAEFARHIRGEVRRLEGVLKEFLELASPVSGTRNEVDLRTVANEVLGLLDAEAAAGNVRLEPVRGEARVSVDRESIRRSLINVTRNAIQATPPGGAVRTMVDVDGKMARVRVQDDGAGIDEEIKDKVFDAFVTGRSDGIGLGLSLVRRVAEEHDGTCSIQNRAGSGAEVTIRLPLNTAENGRS